MTDNPYEPPQSREPPISADELFRDETLPPLPSAGHILTRLLGIAVIGVLVVVGVFRKSLRELPGFGEVVLKLMFFGLAAVLLLALLAIPVAVYYMLKARRRR
ncbi:MAG: hypothetical protein QM811_01245 [Pirellulales bacterium]